MQEVARREGKVLVWAAASASRTGGTHVPSAAHAATSAEARKVVTIVFADLIGSTSLHERLDAESARGLMDRYSRALHAAVEAHGGTVVKLLGDGVMAAFGVPRVNEDDAMRAVVARTRVFPFTHTNSGLALDAVLGGPGLEEEFLRTARQVDVGGVTVPVIGPEELIVTKVLAGRTKDLDDVRGILVAQGEALDLQRVRTLIHVLEAAIDQSDLLPCLEEQLRIARAGR